MKVLKKRESFHLILLVVVTYLANVSFGVTKMNTFLQAPEYLKVSMTTLGPRVTSQDALDCAFECLDLDDRCFSFTYKSETLQCILGSWLVPSSTRDTSAIMYTLGAFCNTTDGFSVATNGTFSACIKLSSVEVNYTLAKSSCKERNSSLYSIRKIEKLNILMAVLSTATRDYWVGLDDMMVEDEFRWDDDGSVLTSETRRLIFYADQPDNYGGYEDCVTYNPVSTPLFDRPCFPWYKYVCEMGPTTTRF